VGEGDLRVGRPERSVYRFGESDWLRERLRLTDLPLRLLSPPLYGEWERLRLERRLGLERELPL